MTEHRPINRLFSRPVSRTDAEPKGAPVLELIAVSKRIGGVKVLRKATATFHEGELTLILGAAQSGKSVLARIIAGQRQADAGQIFRRGPAAPLVGAAWGFGVGGAVLRGLELRAASYGLAFADYIAAVAQLLPDPEVLRRPLERLSATDRAILLYGSSYLIPADLYIAENAPLPSEPEARDALQQVYEAARARAAVVWFTRGDAHAKTFPPDRVLTLADGQLTPRAGESATGF